MDAARREAFDAYKEQMKQAAGDKALPGDSDECDQLINDAIDAINDVQYNENNTLQQNKDAVDAAANLAQLEADLAEHREMNAGPVDGQASVADAMPDDLDAVIRWHVRRVFDKYGQNLSHAAQALKVSRNTVKKYL